jgi:phospholipase C
VFENTGTAGAVFHVYDRRHLDRIPRRYTVEAGKSLDDQWDTSADAGVYDLEVFGPNGFFRSFIGHVDSEEPAITILTDHKKGAISLVINNGKTPAGVQIISNAYDYQPLNLKLASGGKSSKTWPLEKSGNWYDFTVKCSGQPGYERRFAGRVETGKNGVSDPAMATEI